MNRNLYLLFTFAFFAWSCREPAWRKFFMIEEGYGFKFIDKQPIRTDDSLVYWSIDFRFTDSQDSLIASSSVWMDIEPLNKIAGPFDLRQALKFTVPGDSIVVQYSPEAMRVQPFYSALHGIETRADSLVRMHIRVISALNPLQYETKRMRERMNMHGQALQAFTFMVQSNENLSSQEHVPFTTYVRTMQTGKGQQIQPGSQVLLHLSIITSYGKEILNTNGMEPLQIEVMMNDLPRGLDMALVGMLEGSEANVYVPFTENIGSRLLGERIDEFDNLRANVHILAITQ